MSKLGSCASPLRCSRLPELGTLRCCVVLTQATPRNANARPRLPCEDDCARASVSSGRSWEGVSGPRVPENTSIAAYVPQATLSRGSSGREDGSACPSHCLRNLGMFCAVCNAVLSTMCVAASSDASAAWVCVDVQACGYSAETKRRPQHGERRIPSAQPWSRRG